MTPNQFVSTRALLRALSQEEQSDDLHGWVARWSLLVQEAPVRQLNAAINDVRQQIVRLTRHLETLEMERNTGQAAKVRRLIGIRREQQRFLVQWAEDVQAEARDYQLNALRNMVDFLTGEIDQTVQLLRDQPENAAQIANRLVANVAEKKRMLRDAHV